MDRKIVLSEKEQSAIVAETRKLFTSLKNDNVSARDLLSQRFQYLTENRTLRESEMQVEHVFELVNRHSKMVDHARRGSSEWLRTSLDDLMGDKNLEERCRLMHNLKEGYKVLSDEKVIEIFSRLDRAPQEIAGEFEFEEYSGAYTQEALQKLCGEVQTLLINSNFSDERIQKMMDALYMDGNISVTVAAYGIEGLELKSIMALTIYSLAKDKKLECIPEDITLDEAVILICTMGDMQAVMDGALRGHQTFQKAREMMTVILGVGLLVLTICVSSKLLLLVETANSVLGILGYAFLYVSLLESVLLIMDRFCTVIVDTGAELFVNASGKWQRLVQKVTKEDVAEYEDQKAELQQKENETETEQADAEHWMNPEEAQEIVEEDDFFDEVQTVY